MHRSRQSAVFIREVKRHVFPLVPALGSAQSAARAQAPAGTQTAKDWIPAFAGMSGAWVALSIAVAAATTTPVHAQDVRGLEVCTAEKQMERRTSCLQANTDFLQNLIDRNTRDARLKLDAATKEVAAARNEVATMKASLTALQARLEKLEKPEKTEKPNDAQKK